MVFHLFFSLKLENTGTVVSSSAVFTGGTSFTDNLYTPEEIDLILGSPFEQLIKVLVGQIAFIPARVQLFSRVPKPLSGRLAGVTM